jgi:hypothetical protein
MLGLIIPLGVPGGGSPDQSLPGQPGHPSQGLPGQPGHPSQGLPGGGGSGSTLPTDEAWLLAYSPRNGYSWVKASDIVGSGHRPGQELPGGPPPHVSGQPLPGGEHPSGQPVPGQPPHASGQPVPGQPNTPSNQPGGAQPKK